MKNVVVVTSLDISARNSAGSARVINIAKSLALSGVPVYLCCAAASNNIKLDSKKEFSKNIYFLGETNKNISNKQILKLYNIYISLVFVIRIHKLAKSFSSKPVIYLYPQPKTSIDFFSLVYLKLIHRYRIYYEINEIRLFSISNRTYSKNPIKKTYQLCINMADYIKYMLVEKSTKYYDGLIAISTNIESYFSAYNKNILRIPILSDTATNPFVLGDKNCFNCADRFTLCFTGMIELKKEGFDILYQAISLVKKQGIKIDLHLYGPVNNKDKDILLNEMPDQLGIKNNIFYHGCIDQNKIIYEMKKYHLLILPRPLTPQTNTGFSTKLSEYMISGVPVLVTDVSDNAVYIKDNVNGYIVKPGEVEVMANKIIDIINNFEKDYQKIVGNAYETAKLHFDYSNYSVSLSEFMH